MRDFSRATQKAHLGYIERWLLWQKESERVLNDRNVKSFILHLVDVRNCSHSYVNQAISALKLFHELVLGQGWQFEQIRHPKKITCLPKVLSKQEVAKLISALTDLKHRSLMVMLYSARLRAGEVVC